MEERVLLLALRGRDAQVVQQLLTRQGHVSYICGSGDAVAQELANGAGTAVLTEESLADTDLRKLASLLEQQPPWSDFPFVVLTTRRSGRRPTEALRILEQLGNVILLERPINGETLASAVASALRGRRKQYQARQHLQELTAAEERLTQLNNSLETRIGQRTDELARANNKLMEEVAERERAQAALLQVQKMDAVGQLTGGIAHDFNNLLTVISGNLELIRRRVTDEKSGRLAQFALQASDRAAKLTRQLLAFSRTQRLMLRPVDINALILGMDDLLARTLGPRFTIEKDLDFDAPWAMADANQVELAILNLIINARDAMLEGGVLRIASERKTGLSSTLVAGPYVVISVSDTGTGIPAHLIEKVFDPFFTTKPVGKGTGLGLSQVYGIAQQSGGTVRIDSVEGKGCTVEIWLPAANAAPAHESGLAPVYTGEEGRRELVLVIEDDAAVRRFVVECLEALGYPVIEAADGRDGLKRLRAERPALLIVDFVMPGMNGAEVATEARMLAPDLPIILATGHADMEAVAKVIEPDHVLRKPFQIDDLARAVHTAIARSREIV
jgi:signal transduction histidine kinase